jgi:hypothetical protein
MQQDQVPRDLQVIKPIVHKGRLKHRVMSEEFDSNKPGYNTHKQAGSSQKLYWTRYIHRNL